MIKHIILTLVIALGFAIPCDARSGHGIDRNKAIDAIIGESENSPDGMVWVACVIRNRGSLRGVYGGRSKRVKQRLYSSKTFVQAVKAWEASAHGDITCGCMFWFSDADLKMKKVKRIIRLEKLVLVKRISGNNFYKHRESR